MNERLASVRRKDTLNNRVIEAGWLTLAACLPLAMSPWSRNPFELPKTVLLWTVVAVMGAARLALHAGSEAQRLRHAGPGAGAIAFGAALLLSTLFSISPVQSAQGSYERLQGALTILCYLALFLLVVDRLHTSGQAWRLLRAIAWGSAPVVAYGLLQSLGFDPLAWEAEGSPVIGTLGRSNFLGGYLVLVLPVTWACTVQARSKTQRAASAGLLMVQLICLATAKSRAAWLGAGTAGCGLLLVYAWLRGYRRGATVAAGLGFVGLSSGLIALALTHSLTGSLGARAAIWRATWPLIAARPALGYGPDTFGQVFTAVYPPELVYLQGRAVLVDRAHNLVLDTLVSTGALGLIAAVALAGSVLVAGTRALNRSQDRRTRVALAAALAAVAGHMAETQASFPITATAALFWIVLGVLAGSWVEPLTPPAHVYAPRCVRWPHRVLAILVLVAVLPASTAILVADAYAGQSQRTDTVAGLQRSIAAMEHALALWPTQPEYLEHLSWLHLTLAKADYNSPAEFQAAEAALDAALRLTPGAYRLWAGLGELYTEWGKAGDTDRFVQADKAYRRTTTLFPGSAMLHTGWGMSYLAEGRIAEATDQFHQATHLDQTDAWAYRRLGDVLLVQDDLTGAAEAYRNALRWEPDMAGAYRGLGHASLRQDQFKVALVAYQAALSLTSGDPDLYLDIARCYEGTGQSELACQVVEDGLLIAPNHPELLVLHAGCR